MFVRRTEHLDRTKPAQRGIFIFDLIREEFDPFRTQIRNDRINVMYTETDMGDGTPVAEIAFFLWFRLDQFQTGCSQLQHGIFVHIGRLPSDQCKPEHITVKGNAFVQILRMNTNVMNFVNFAHIL